MLEIPVLTLSFIALLISVLCWVLIRRAAIDSPFLYLSYLLGMGVVGQCLAIFLFGQGVVIDGILVDAKVDLLAYGALVLVVFVILFSVGFMFLLRRGSGHRTKLQVHDVILSNVGLMTASIVVLCAVGYSLHVFATQSNQGLVDLVIGSNKQLVLTSGGVSGFESAGYVRSMSRLGMTLFLTLLAARLVYPEIAKRYYKFLLIGSGLIALIPAFALSNRGAIFYALVCVVTMLLIRGQFSFRRISVGMAIVFGLFSVMSAIRLGSEGGFDPRLGLMSLFFYGGGISIFNTTMLAEYVASGGALRYGAIYLGIAVLPIPRAMWPEKPLFALDQIIAADIYGLHGYGAAAIPAGLPGELILNFGFAGGAFASVLSGAIVALVYQKALFVQRPLLSLLIRGVVLPRAMLSLFGSGVGFAVMEAVLVGIPVLLCYWVIFREQEAGNGRLGRAFR